MVSIKSVVILLLFSIFRGQRVGFYNLSVGGGIMFRPTSIYGVLNSSKFHVCFFVGDFLGWWGSNQDSHGCQDDLGGAPYLHTFTGFWTIANFTPLCLCDFLGWWGSDQDNHGYQDDLDGAPFRCSLEDLLSMETLVSFDPGLWPYKPVDRIWNGTKTIDW